MNSERITLAAAVAVATISAEARAWAEPPSLDDGLFCSGDDQDLSVRGALSHDMRRVVVNLGDLLESRFEPFWLTRARRIRESLDRLIDEYRGVLADADHLVFGDLRWRLANVDDAVRGSNPERARRHLEAARLEALRAANRWCGHPVD
jgi:hypothetical protein